VREQLAQLADGAAYRVELWAQLSRPDPEPELRRIEAEAFNISGDPGGLIPVEGKNSDAELEARRGSGELSERLQARRRRVVVAPQ